MENKQIILGLTFIWCIFMGITVCSIGLGAAFPSMNRIAKPFVCPRGEMQLETQEYNPSPIESVTTLTWYCVDSVTAERVELGIFPMSLYAGAIYGLLLFLVIFVGGKIWMGKLPRNEAAGKIQRASAAFTKRSDASSRVSRLQELKEMRAANLITELEYEQKRAEILQEL